MAPILALHHKHMKLVKPFTPVVPKVGGTAPLGAVKQKWAIGGVEAEMDDWEVVKQKWAVGAR